MFEAHMEMIGEPHIPEEKHNEFRERMLTLFKEAGLMDFETVMLADKSIYLLKEPEFDENDILSCEYSVYDFEWKDALRFSGDSLVLRTGYIGYKKFSKAAKAAFTLLELYSDTDCISGSIDDWHCVKECVGWINYIFNERIAVEAVRKYSTEQFMIIDRDLLLYRLDSLEGTTDILQSWVADWKEKYDKAIVTVSKPINTIKLVDALCEADDAFDNVIMFRDTFLELIENSSDDRYMALFQLFADVLNEEKAVLSEDDKLILNIDNPSEEAIKRRKKHVYIGNRKLNMLLELMYNRKLRESVFGV